MKGVAFAREFGSQIRIAFPVGEIRTCDRPIATRRKSAVWQCVGKDVANRILQFGAAGEIASFAGGIAPSAVLSPVPSRHSKLGVIAIADRSPSGRKRFLDDVRRV